ncbi:MAG TPA: guanylate kinase [Armatimonadota bacterium]|jgi:guanylate kinase
MTSDRGQLFVLSAPSGAGKDALLYHVLRACPDLKKCVTVTTRQQRQGEVDGVDYRFVTPQQFEDLRSADALLEWAEVFGNFYGTPRQWVLDQLAEGNTVILKIDVQGGQAVKSLYPESVLVFVAPPSVEEQERRLRERQTESEQDLSLRLSEAAREMAAMPEYDYVVVNDDLAHASDLVRCIVRAEGCRVRPPRKG